MVRLTNALTGVKVDVPEKVAAGLGHDWVAETPAPAAEEKQKPVRRKPVARKKKK